MITPDQLFPTHSDIAICLSGRGNFRNPKDKIPVAFIITVALENANSMPVQIPWNTVTESQFKLLKQTILESPFFVCGVRFDNLKIYRCGDSGYRATATGINEIIP